MFFMNTALKPQYQDIHLKVKGKGWAYQSFLVKNLLKKIYRVSQEERTKLPESVPYVKLYRYNPKHLYPKLNGYGDNGQRSLKL